MKLYANGILLNAAAQSVTLEKSRGDAAATLTAVLLTAAAIQEGCRRAALLFARRKAETAYIFGDLYKKFIFTSPIEMFYN